MKAKVKGLIFKAKDKEKNLAPWPPMPRSRQGLGKARPQGLGLGLEVPQDQGLEESNSEEHESHNKCSSDVNIGHRTSETSALFLTSEHRARQHADVDFEK